MIVYTPFWKTLRASRESTYTLIKNHHLSSSTIDKLRKNKPIFLYINKDNTDIMIKSMKKNETHKRIVEK